MHYKVEWYDDDHTIVLRTLKPGWGWEDFVEAFMKSFSMVQSVDHRVDIIFDDSEAPEAPGVGALEHFAEVAQEQPENVGWFVVVGADPFMREMGQTFTANFMGHIPDFRSVFVDTMQEALNVLAERDA